MDKRIPLQQSINVTTMLRQAGYHPHDGSWVRFLSGSHYPRFHLYLQVAEQHLGLSLHLDQKQHTINLPGLKRHAGDYKSAVVQAELERVMRWIQYAQSIS